MFCLAQLASIVGGILLASQSRKFFALWDVTLGRHIEFPARYELLINHGWMLVAIPIACVLIVPRHREDEDPQDVKWRWYSYAAAGFGIIVLCALGLGIAALIQGIAGPPHHIIYSR